jgi:hypothetical protein
VPLYEDVTIMRNEYFEYNGVDENPFIRKHILANPEYSDLIAFCRKKAFKLNIVVRVIYGDAKVRMIGHLFDISLDTPEIIEAFSEEMAEADFERMHEYYLFGLNSIEMEAF